MELNQKETIAIRNALHHYRHKHPFKEEYKDFLQELEERFLVDRIDKIKEIAKELIKIKSIRQGFDKEGNYIAFDKRKL